MDSPWRGSRGGRGIVATAPSLQRCAADCGLGFDPETLGTNTSMAIKRSFTLVTLCLAGLCFAPVAQAEPNTAAREAIEDAIAKCNFTLGAPSQEAALAKRMADNHVNPETLRLRQDQWKDLRAQAVAIDPAIVNFAGNVGDYGAVKVRVAYCDRAYDVAIAAVVAAV